MKILSRVKARLVERMLPRNSENPLMVRLLLVLVFFAAVAAGPVSAAPCTTATDACTEWITFGSGPARSLVYTSYPLNVPNDAVTRALILVHAAGRNADGFFRIGVDLATKQNALDHTVIISLRFASNQDACKDMLAQDEVNWDCGGKGGGWRVGTLALNNPQLTSFDLTDTVVRMLAHPKIFPNLKMITVAGFSAGAQYVNRYSMANQVHDSVQVPVTYVVASPSTYVYPDPSRPTADQTSFQPLPQTANCPGYNNWSFGLSDRTGYSTRLTEEQLRKQLISRPITYAVGGAENPKSAGLDVSCEAMAQGTSRLVRAQIFTKYMKEKYGAKQKLIVAPGCDHDAPCVLSSKDILPVLFP